MRPDLGHVNFRRVSIDRLNPAEYNPRKDLQPGDPEYAALEKSMTTFGCVEAIIWNEATGNVVGGHQRLKVLIAEGATDADVIVVNIENIEEEKALNVALNKISGDWDFEKLEDVIRDICDAGIDASLTGFTADEIAELFGDEVEDEKPNVENDGFDAEAARDAITDPITARGDVWILGRHRLMCGDTTDAKDMSRLMDGAIADLCVTDPPYNVDYGDKQDMLNRLEKGARNCDNIHNDKMTDADFQRFTDDSFRNISAALKPGGALYCFHAGALAEFFLTAIKKSGFRVSEILVWIKNNFVIGMLDYHWQHEPIIYGWKNGASHYFIDDRHQRTVFDDARPENFRKMKKDELLRAAEALYNQLHSEETTVLRHDKPQVSAEHPTMKPVTLIGRLVFNSSRPGEIVIDPFGGSGTTLIACEQLDRRCITMEIDATYCDVIVKRWEAFTGQTAKLIR